MGIPPDAIIARIVVYSHESEKRSTVDATVSTFRVNFEIPDHAGIGKSVSRGFGTVERIPETSGPKEGSAAC